MIDGFRVPARPVPVARSRCWQPLCCPQYGISGEPLPVRPDCRQPLARERIIHAGQQGVSAWRRIGWQLQRMRVNDHSPATQALA